MRPLNYFWAPVKTSSIGACLFGMVVLLTACASQQAAQATPTVVALPTLPVVTPYPTATDDVPPTFTPNAAAMGAGCGSGPFLTIPLAFGTAAISLPPHSYVSVGFSAITGDTQEKPICTASSTRAAISQFMNTTLPAEGWKPYNPTKDSGCMPGVAYQWVKAVPGYATYALAFDFTKGVLMPLLPHYWGLIECSGVYSA